MMKRPLRRIRRELQSFVETLVLPRDELRPPLRLMRRHGYGYLTPRSYQVIGQQFFHYFVDLCGLAPHSRVLEVGCGMGRMAVPLTSYLTTGSYEGFDIIVDGVEWCQKNISSRFPNFRFQLADVYNAHYNPKGHYKASEYRFPYADETFDLVFLTSVFTHMLPPDMEHYLAEIVRVARKNARTLITFFLLNPEADALIREGKSTRSFLHQLENCRADSQKNPEAAIAFEEAFLRNCYARRGLQLQEPIRYGRWCGRDKFLSGQDIIIATKI